MEIEKAVEKLIEQQNKFIERFGEVAESLESLAKENRLYREFQSNFVKDVFVQQERTLTTLSKMHNRVIVVLTTVISLLTIALIMTARYLTPYEI